MIWWIDVMVAVFGAAMGSFLNVCIWRIPVGRSIVTPRSACPACGHAIRFYDNIPLISYVLLRGKCRDCRKGIPVRYPVVEGLAGALALFLFWKYGFSLMFLAVLIYVAVLIVIAFIDMDHQMIPDSITLPGIPLSMLAAMLVMNMPFLESLLGLIVGGGILYLIAQSYAFLRKREGMGGGDIKLLAMIGAFLGWKSLIFVLLISSLSGAIVGVTLIALRKQGMKDALPFGPFLALAAVTWIFWGELFMQVFTAG
jgi:leader peptidase (prepilin peptidase) / N-methyltransferase